MNQDEDYRFAKIIRAVARERKIGLMEACEAFLREHREYGEEDRAACRRTAKAMIRNAETRNQYDRGTDPSVARTE